MCKALKIICALFVMTCPTIAQNEIDYVNSLYWSGYGKMAIDGDTLYLNSFNGHGVERYYIADPANPVFIDRENISGFDQIDFERRLMAQFRNDRIIFSDFSDFGSARLLSHINIPPQTRYYYWPPWKLAGDYLFIALEDDSIRTYNISDPANPILSATIGVVRTPIGWDIVFGSTACVIVGGQYPHVYWDVYNISDPNNIILAHSDTLSVGPLGSYAIYAGRGDTMVTEYITSAGFSWYLRFISYAPGDTSQLPSWGESMNGRPPGYYSNDNAFLLYRFYLGVISYSFYNFVTLGKAPDPFTYGGDSYTFDCTTDNHFITASKASLFIYQPTYSDTIFMPQVGQFSPAHYGILSSASYGNYILSGAESNGGELLIHELGQSGNLNLISVLPNVQAKEIRIVGSTALCLCPDRMVAVDISNPESPAIRHEITGFNGPLVDFVDEDSLLFIITDRAFSAVQYSAENGFMLRGALYLPGAPLTAITQYGRTFFALKGSTGIIVRIGAADPSNPIVWREYRLPYMNYTDIEQMHNTLWASCAQGTSVINARTEMDSVAFFGPEYFLDVHQMYISNETLFVADGINGIKLFTFRGHPYSGLSFIGGYGTGNVVNQVARIGDDFIVSDYYSLQHLRWGAPTGTEPDYNPHLPQQFTLEQNYPNPFNSSTTLAYSLPTGASAKLAIYDISGRLVRSLDIFGGKGNVVWDGKAQTGIAVSSGVYFYRISAGTYSDSRKMLLIK